MWKNYIFTAISLAAALLLAGCAAGQTAEAQAAESQQTEAQAAAAQPAESQKAEAETTEAQSAEPETTEVQHAESQPTEGTDGAPVVYFTSDISPESLVKIYEKLGWTPSGKTAVKISTGEPPRKQLSAAGADRGPGEEGGRDHCGMQHCLRRFPREQRHA